MSRAVHHSLVGGVQQRLDREMMDYVSVELWKLSYATLIGYLEHRRAFITVSLNNKEGTMSVLVCWSLQRKKILIRWPVMGL